MIFSCVAFAAEKYPVIRPSANTRILSQQRGNSGSSELASETVFPAAAKASRHRCLPWPEDQRDKSLR